MDHLTKAERSGLMARITGDDLGPEKAMRRALRALGVRFRRNAADLPGTPDIVVSGPSGRVAAFVHGVFWHGGRGWRRPQTRPEFWVGKIAANVRRDKRVRRALRKLGYMTLVVWETEVASDPMKAAARVARRAGWNRR